VGYIWGVLDSAIVVEKRALLRGVEYHNSCDTLLICLSNDKTAPLSDKGRSYWFSVNNLTTTMETTALKWR
jgi:hypothetical protein